MPIGLPDFDSWVLVAEALPATKALPAVRPRMHASRRLRGWRDGLVLATVGTAITAAAALSLSNASEPRAPAAGRSPAPPPHAAAGSSAHRAVLPSPEPVLSAPVMTVPALAESIAAAPASGLEAGKSAPPKRSKRTKSAALPPPNEPAAAPPSPPTRVIMSWDW